MLNSFNSYPNYQNEDFKTFENEDIKISNNISSSIRQGFIRKVYGILSIQLLITTIFSLITMNYISLQKFMLNHIGISYLMIVITIILPFIIICCNDIMNKIPQNYIILFLFTFAESYLVSFICALSNPKLVFMASLMTFIMVFSLTYYAYNTENDMTTQGSTLFICSIGLILFSFFGIFTRNKLFHVLICVFGVVLFGFYLVYDTQIIIGTKSEMIEMDNYILGAFILYTDIVYIFLKILEILQYFEGKE
jgi:FtsH-binding integral membrane protein